LEVKESGLRTAIFAGGCFWGIADVFEGVDGVESVVSGYIGGHVPFPSYRDVCAGTTGHYEAVMVQYDPRFVNYRDLLEVFWRNIDPTDTGGQFADRGGQYVTAIFYVDRSQKILAEYSLAKLDSMKLFDRPIVTEILPAAEFYPAEEYHQAYFKKHPDRKAQAERYNGKREYLNWVWSGHEDFRIFQNSRRWLEFHKPDRDALRKMLTGQQYAVTQEKGTELAFHNAYWDNRAPGIYVDVVSGEPLFASTDKFDSGTGWPSFTRPLDPDNVVEVREEETGRIEVRSVHGDSHLGHVFDDGPAPTGRRYCINSTALNFIPADSLAAAGYPEYSVLFR